jgi:hypothetical protein
VALLADGRPGEAEALIATALEALPYSSPRRWALLALHADGLVALGAWDRADTALDEAYRLAETADDARARAQVTWSRAHTAAGRGDSVRAERLFREVERDATDWWEDHGADFLCDAARTLDTLGLSEQALGYVRRARALTDSRSSEADQLTGEAGPLVPTRALILARSGDPGAALAALGALTPAGQLQRRQPWRFGLLSAWARLRSGDRPGAADEAAAAFDQVIAHGGVGVALAAEPDITSALAPLAAEAGNPVARALLRGDAQLVVRLFGAPEVSAGDEDPVRLPAGRPGELVRMLALHPHGLPAEVVLEAFFPGAAPKTSRHRLRQVLTRLRSAAGEIVIRDGEMLRLVPAWVDVAEFGALTRRARASRGTRQLILSVAALGLAGRGPLLAADPSAAWAQEIRATVDADLEQLRRELNP